MHVSASADPWAQRGRAMKKKLWTKDFTLITTTTILSAVGGEAMSLPVSLLVFDETQSTFLSSLILVCSMLPDILLPILISPIIDKFSKKKWIVGLDILMAAIYIGMGFWLLSHPFQYGLYLVYTLAVAAISVFYNLSYCAWYPDLIPAGSEQKGYSVSATIYPTVTILMAPAATFLYEHVAMGYIFLFVGALTVLSISLEVHIREIRPSAREGYGIRQYFTDIREGFRYIRKEKGIRNIYTYMGITNGVSNGVGLITQAYYQTQAWLTVTMLGFLKSSEMIGRMMGGLVQYKKEIPVNKRYGVTKFVYTFYNAMDSLLLYMPFPFMLANRFLCGALGTTTATLRETAVQCYLPPEIRARIMAFFQVFFAVGGIAFQLLAGFLGQYLPFRPLAFGLGMFSMISMAALIFVPKNQNRPVFEAVREEPK